MQFNEFQRRLEHCHLDEDTKYLLSHMFEVQIGFSQHLDLSLSLLEKLTNAVQRTTQMNNEVMEQIKELQRRDMNGIDVHSVRNDPDDV
jgi:hypothetical protein